jgi:hypothetical protein
LKNIQVIDGADNSSYSIFAATKEEFEAIFPLGADIEFAEDFFERVGEERGTKITVELWKRPVAKKGVRGIHGIGIDPDYRLHVLPQLLEQNDGPMLEGLKKLQGMSVHLPRREKDHPDRDRLSLRFERFKAAY